MWAMTSHQKNDGDPVVTYAYLFNRRYSILIYRYAIHLF